jgi:hypothetical protein
MITQNEVKKHKEEILKGFQLETTPTPKSLLALFFSGLISTFGIYSILKGMIEGKALYIALGIFVIILGVADTFKRGSLAKYYNSIIRKKILESGKILKLNLYIFFLAISFMVVFDIVGSFSTANYVEQKYKDYRATSSKEYELLKDEAKEGKTSLELYSQELTTWQNDKKDAYKICDEKWRGWKSKYKAKCKEEWRTNNPKPTKPTENGTVSVNDYKELKDGVNDDFLSKYIFYIVLFLSISLTLLLQYTTVSEIQDKKDDIEESLTGMIIGILQDRIHELETNFIQHETKRNELISNADKKEKELGRDFEERGKAISILSMEKAVQSRGETVKRIANNQYVPHDRAKAGFVDFSLNQEDIEPNQEPKEQNNKKDYNDEEMIYGLYANTFNSDNTKLTPKKDVININKRKEVEKISKIYKVLTKAGAIELRGNKGYYALKDYDEALKIYRDSLIGGER